MRSAESEWTDERRYSAPSVCLLLLSLLCLPLGVFVCACPRGSRRDRTWQQDSTGQVRPGRVGTATKENVVVNGDGDNDDNDDGYAGQRRSNNKSGCSRGGN